MIECGRSVLWLLLLVFVLYLLLWVEMVIGNSEILNVMKVVEVLEEKYSLNCVLISCVKCYDYVCFL